MADALVDFVVAHPVASLIVAVATAIMAFGLLQALWHVVVAGAAILVVYFSYLIVTGQEPPRFEALEEDGRKVVERAADGERERLDAAKETAREAVREEVQRRLDDHPR